MSGRRLTYPRLSPIAFYEAMSEHKVGVRTARAAAAVLVAGHTPYRAAREQHIDQSTLRRTLARIIRSAKNLQESQK